MDNACILGLQALRRLSWDHELKASLAYVAKSCFLKKKKKKLFLLWKTSDSVYVSLKAV